MTEEQNMLNIIRAFRNRIKIVGKCDDGLPCTPEHCKRDDCPHPNRKKTQDPSFSVKTR